MPLELQDQPTSPQSLLAIEVRGRVAQADYERFAADLARLAATGGRARVLVELRGFEGQEPGSGWEALGRDLGPLGGIERLAVVGDRRWRCWMSLFSQPFCTAVVRYFDIDEDGEARQWLAS